RESDALNQSTDFDYGIYDQPTITLDKRGNPTTRHYHATTDINANSVAGKLARIEATINGVANVILEEYAYYADAAQTNFGQIKQRVEYIDQNDSARQRITDYVYHPNGIDLHQQTVSGATTGGSVTTEFSYDLLGRVLTETLQRRRSAIDPTLESLVTTFEYDALNRVVKITNPRGDISETVYDANGQVAEEKIHYATTIAKNGCAAPSGGFVTCTVAIHAYDAADRRISTTDVFGNTVMFEYDEVGNLTAETDANGHTTRFDYDEMDRRDAIIDANGHRTEMSYDLAGRLVATKDANGNRTQSEYDALGRVTKTISQAGRETIFDYDENGNQTHLTDANAVAGSQPKNNENASVYAEFDELNRPILARDATNGETISTYDLLGNITSITDAEGQVTTFIYDDLGRLIETIDPIIESPTDKTERITQYDQAGNVLESEDRTGRIARHTYDVLNRRTQTDYLSDATSEMLIYDDYGDLVSLANDEVTYSYSYDARHSMLSKTDSRLGKGMSWTYDPVGNIKTKTNYEGDVTTFQYDSTNRLVAMTNPSFLQVSYHYDGAGRLLNRILSNGAKTDYAYDEDNRLTGLKNVSADGTVIEDLIYTHDEVGNISSITDNASSESTAYVYDALYRLIDVDSTVNAQDRTYTYDAVGNRKTLLANGTMHHYCYHPTDCSQGPQGNRLHNIRVGSPTGSFHREFTYDDAGRLDTKLDASGGLMVNLTYDGKGNVAEISTSSQTHNFAYDPNAYRIEKDTKHYHLEGEHLEASYDASGTLEEKYLRGVVIDEIVNGFHYLSSDPNDWTNYTFHHDQINSVTALTGHAGAIEEEIRYDAFGAPLTLPTPGTGNDLTYTGREYDRDTGLYYYRARYYDAEIGRFTAEDPLGFQAGDVNFYAYVANRPMVENDPTGKICGSGLCIGGLILGRTVGPPIARFLASNTVRSSVISGSVAGTAGGVGTFITSGGDLKMAGQAFGANFAGAALLGPAIGSRANLILGTNARSTLTANLLTTGIVDSTTQLLRDGQVDLLRSGLALGATAFGTFLLTDGLLTAGSTALTDVALVEGIQTALGVAGDFTFQAANKVRQNLYPVNGRGANAAGGFVLYPGRANTNQQLVVYEK
ncbi:MAG: RHS repeat-associated core domain-containing protein, partial [Pseudomonadota bacterium]